MAQLMDYLNQVQVTLTQRDPDQSEFLEAVANFLPALVPVLKQHPEYIQANILERLIEPERVIQFRVPWLDDQNQVRVNRGFRVQFNSAIGPYKGGLRFHPSVNLAIIKFLGFEQTFKNSLTGLPIGGGKGGSDFDPKDKSDGEIMRFCQSFMAELQKYIGPDLDVPAGDIGVGAREIGYLFGQYKRLNGFQNGTLTGKGLAYGGSLMRPEATGFGLLYYTAALLKSQQQSLAGKRIKLSGAGNVALYALEKATKLGAKVLTASDSKGYIYDPAGIDFQLLQQLKFSEHQRISAYAQRVSTAQYVSGSVWQAAIKSDLALPCATQNEIDGAGAQQLVADGVKTVVEGANMPSTPEALKVYHQAGILFGPAKAANAGGVAVSALEMSQNSQRLAWSATKVDHQLQTIMQTIFNQVIRAAETYDLGRDYAAGANIAAFTKVADAMLAQGIV